MVNILVERMAINLSDSAYSNNFKPSIHTIQYFENAMNRYNINEDTICEKNLQDILVWFYFNKKNVMKSNYFNLAGIILSCKYLKDNNY